MLSKRTGEDRDSERGRGFFVGDDDVSAFETLGFSSMALDGLQMTLDELDVARQVFSAPLRHLSISEKILSTRKY